MENMDLDWLSRALMLYPSGNLLALFLHNVTGPFGYSYYESGELLRSIFGDGDGDGVIFDRGVIQPEEENC